MYIYIYIYILLLLYVIVIIIIIIIMLTTKITILSLCYTNYVILRPIFKLRISKFGI